MENEYRRDPSGESYFWIDCPGCDFAGKIGVPHDYPANVVVCPNCRQVVRVRGSTPRVSNMPSASAGC